MQMETAPRNGSLHHIRDRINWFTQVGYVTLNLFMKTEMQNQAAAAAYYFLLSAIPLILLMFFIFNSILGDYPDLYGRFFPLFRSVDHMLDINLLKNLNKSSGIGQLAGGVSILTLIWSSRGLLNSVQNSFGIIFSDFGRRGAISSGFISLSIVPIAMLVVALSISGSYINDHLGLYLTSQPLFNVLLTGLFHAIGYLFPALLLWYVIFSAYYRITPQKPRLNLTLVSSGLCALSILALKHFLIDSPKIAQYDQTYGTLGNMVFVLICVYSIFVIFYLWAQFLQCAGKIDIIALEKIFIESAEQTGLAKKLEDFLFRRSSRIFQKYGKPFKKGEMVIRQGEQSNTIYFLYKGELGFYREQDSAKSKLGILKPGEIFGEMAYFLNEARTATVMAETYCFLFVISPDTLEALLRDSATLSRKIIALLCQRIYRNHSQAAALEQPEEKEVPIQLAPQQA